MPQLKASNHFDLCRKESEGYDCAPGFQITHPLGGRTGSGVSTLLLMKRRDNYPSSQVSNVVGEPYNAILPIHQLLRNTDETFVIDNEELHNISHNTLKQHPKYAKLNWVIPLVMSGTYASAILRLSGSSNDDLRKTDLTFRVPVGQ